MSTEWCIHFLFTKSKKIIHFLPSKMVGLQLHGGRIYGTTEGIIPKQKSSTPFPESISLASKAMEKCSSNLSFVSMYHHHLLLLLLILSFLFSSVKASSAVQLMDNSTQDPMCEFVDCGEGRCIASNGDLGFDCECNPGWKKIRIGPLTFPSCVVPNCTLDLQCGQGESSPDSLPPTPSPASLLPSSFDLLDSCTYVWCGEGRRVANGSSGHTCQCNEGSANFLNKSSLACLKQCNLGADCTGLGFGQHSPPPPSLSGSIGVSNCWGCLLQVLTMVVVAAVFLVWV